MIIGRKYRPFFQYVEHNCMKKCYFESIFYKKARFLLFFSRNKRIFADVICNNYGFLTMSC